MGTLRLYQIISGLAWEITVDKTLSIEKLIEGDLTSVKSFAITAIGNGLSVGVGDLVQVGNGNEVIIGGGDNYLLVKLENNHYRIEKNPSGDTYIKRPIWTGDLLKVMTQLETNLKKWLEL